MLDSGVVTSGVLESDSNGEIVGKKVRKRMDAGL